MLPPVIYVAIVLFAMILAGTYSLLPIHRKRKNKNTSSNKIEGVLSIAIGSVGLFLLSYSYIVGNDTAEALSIKSFYVLLAGGIIICVVKGSIYLKSRGANKQ